MGDDEALDLLDLLYRLSRLVISDARRSTADAAGLEMPEFVLLRAIAAETTSPGDLARELDVHPAAISRTVTQLVKAGLLERLPSPADSRRFVLALTEQGRATTDAIAAKVRPALRARLAALTQNERTELRSALRRLL
ncbi:MarR family transcriptional regulator TamR [Amycolatopsis ultiminotia]|uniref:MarR family transcriptional regulator TamR n=1 Tax=Amycolatopsis ultiminotia TaxID=543629 RepID=A0ABP6YJ27_9PSEU